MVKLKNILENTKVIQRSHEWPSETDIKESMPYNTKTPAFKKADKVLSYLAKYYGLKLKDPRQAASDISRFL